MLDLVTVDGMWVEASKTKPMRVKHITALLSDLKVVDHLLVRTLEGDQAVRTDVFVCVGPAGEMWQQPTPNVFKKYTIISCDESGWWTALPKEGNAVDACLITDSIAPDGEFSVLALWGTASDKGEYYQTGNVGDWVLRSRDNPKDVWIVRGDIFAATYEIQG